MIFDILITYLKGTRSRTLHPLRSQFAHFSTQFRAFISSIGSPLISNSFLEAMLDPGWQITMDDEMHLLEQEDTRASYTSS